MCDAYYLCTMYYHLACVVIDSTSNNNNSRSYQVRGGLPYYMYKNDPRYLLRLKIDKVKGIIPIYWCFILLLCVVDIGSAGTRC